MTPRWAPQCGGTAGAPCAVTGESLPSARGHRRCGDAGVTDGRVRCPKKVLPPSSTECGAALPSLLGAPPAAQAQCALPAGRGAELPGLELA